MLLYSAIGAQRGRQPSCLFGEVRASPKVATIGYLLVYIDTTGVLIILSLYLYIPLISSW